MMQQLMRNWRGRGHEGGDSRSVICSGEPRIDTFLLLNGDRRQPEGHQSPDGKKKER